MNQPRNFKQLKPFMQDTNLWEATQRNHKCHEGYSDHSIVHD